MKKTSILIITVFIMSILTACGSSADNSQKQETIAKQPEATSMTVEPDENVSETNDTAEDTKIVNNETDSVKIAVVYFSGTGNTKTIAETIAEETGADIFEIIPTQAYKEQNDDTARPEISNDLSATTEYDIVYLGHPIWWGTVPRIIQTYLETYDLSNATIYTFCTSGGSSIDRSLSDLRAWYPTLNIIDGKRLKDASKSEIAEFCNR